MSAYLNIIPAAPLPYDRDADRKNHAFTYWRAGLNECEGIPAWIAIFEASNPDTTPLTTIQENLATLSTMDPGRFSSRYLLLVVRSLEGKFDRKY